MTTFSFDAIGTKWEITIEDDISPQENKRLEALVLDRINVFDKNYSRFRNDSLVSEMVRNPGTYTLPEDATPMLSLYEDLYHKTNGYFTPLVSVALEDLGYDATYSFLPKPSVRLPYAWDEALSFVSPRSLTLHKKVMLDFGAGGKGYLVDIVAALLQKEGIEEFCIDAGGDIVQYANAPLRVALEDPEEETNAIGIVEIQNESICASAGSRRAWGAYHHIVDPKKGESVKTILGVWVIAKTALLADSIATCLFFVEPKVLLDEYVFQYVIMYSDRSVAYSKDLKGEIF